MKKAGARLSLTPVEAARFSYVALTPCARRSDPDGVFALSLHDAGHMVGAHGTSEIEETAGDQYVGFLVQSIYAHDPSSRRASEQQQAQIPIDSAHSLDQQPAVVSAINDQMSRNFRAMDELRIEVAVVKEFYRIQRRETTVYHPKMTWTEKLADDAKTIWRLLKPQIVHLTPRQQTRIQTLVDQHGWTSLDKGYGAPMVDTNPYQIGMLKWVRGVLAPAVAKESKPCLMNWSQFQQRAQHMVAFGLLLERTSPSVLSAGRTGLGINATQLPAAVRNFDLRRTYPQILLEVQRNIPALPQPRAK